MPFFHRPSTVTNLSTLTSVEALSDTTIRVCWYPPNGEEGVIGYKISFTTSTADCPTIKGGIQTVNGGATITYVLTGLEEYTEYHISLRVENSEGYGPSSDVMIARTAANSE